MASIFLDNYAIQFLRYLTTMFIGTPNPSKTEYLIQFCFFLVNNEKIVQEMKNTYVAVKHNGKELTMPKNNAEKGLEQKMYKEIRPKFDDVDKRIKKLIIYKSIVSNLSNINSLLSKESDFSQHHSNEDEEAFKKKKINSLLEEQRRLCVISAQLEPNLWFLFANLVQLTTLKNFSCPSDQILKVATTPSGKPKPKFVFSDRQMGGGQYV